MTLTAKRPLLGFSKGRDMSLFRVAQASALISAFSVCCYALKIDHFWRVVRAEN